jgi:hypothetical protein
MGHGDPTANTSSPRGLAPHAEIGMKQRLVYLAVTLLCALTVSPIAVTWTYLPA